MLNYKTLQEFVTKYELCSDANTTSPDATSPQATSPSAAPPATPSGAAPPNAASPNAAPPATPSGGASSGAASNEGTGNQQSGTGSWATMRKEWAEGTLVPRRSLHFDQHTVDRVRNAAAQAANNQTLGEEEKIK